MKEGQPMNENMERYISSVESLNSQKVIKHVLKKIDADNIEHCNLIQMEQLIVNALPNSPKEIITIVYVLSSYFKYLQEQGILEDDSAYEMVQSLEKNYYGRNANHKQKRSLFLMNNIKE